jgi:RNA polymerase sigma-70 factor (ECF subfamily)
VLDHRRVDAPGTPAPDGEALLVALRRRDPDACARLVEQHHDILMRSALTYVQSRTAAEEIVQDTWAGALRSLPHFEGRSSPRTWLHGILNNKAVDYVRREARTVPFSAVAPAGHGGEIADDAVASTQIPEQAPPWAANTRAPRPDLSVIAAEQRRDLAAAIARLPRRQRLVLSLRDVEGWSAQETADVLAISAANQRVLLHRGRVRVRDALRAEGPVERAA